MRYNRKCNYCGEEYYCCKSCISINSWKNVCCSVKCYRSMISEGIISLPQELKKEVVSMKTLLRAGLKNKDTIDITGYDLELGKFDCSDNKTRVYEDFSYFIVPVGEMIEIVSFFENKIKKAEEEKVVSDKRSSKQVKKTDNNLSQDDKNLEIE